MTDYDETPQTPPTEPLAKEPAPGLSMRAPRPPVVRLRKSVVQAIVIGGAVLVSASLAWAFVIQPDMRANARERAEAARDDETRGSVRPTDVVTDQPASYDRLPDPRTARTDPVEAVDETARSAATANPPPAYRPAQTRPAGPGPRELAARSALFFETAAPAAPAPVGAGARQTPGDVPSDYGAMYSGHGLVAPLSPFELKAGAIVPAALLTAIDTAREGPVIATVTQNVFDSISGRHLLVPQGARLIGRAEGGGSYGDRRAFVTWQRLILPNGKSLLLSDEAGVDAQGAIGVRGQVDRRLFPMIVGTLFAGAITTLGQIARDDDGGSRSLIGDVGDAAAIEGSQVGGRLIDRELGVQPSVRLRAGAPVRVLITRDLILEPYQP